MLRPITALALASLLFGACSCSARAASGRPGNQMAPDPSTPPALWTASGYSPQLGLYKSTDGGSDWTYYRLANATAARAAGLTQARDDVYSLDVDPNDSKHLVGKTIWRYVE
jgi:hypothetical protein